jgi:hypothetical protein
MTTDLTVAETIRQQLGGRRLIVMTGAKNFVGGSDFLMFRLPSNFAKNRINYVKIVLNAMDTYDIEFGCVLGLKYTVVSRSEGVYVGDLRRTFTVATGLYLNF